jgi:hypothetical protein
MKINQKLSVFSLALLMAFTACNNDDEDNGQLSKTEAQSKISSFNSSATTDLQALSDAEGLEAVKEFFALVDQDDPFGKIGTDQKKIKSFLKARGREFRTVFAPASISGRTNGEEAFDFDASKGVYEWNALDQVFEKTDESTIISIKFPTEGSETNNAELQLTAYAEEFITDEFGGSYEPTLLEAAVLVNGVEKASLGLEIAYDEAGFPVAADITLSVAPFAANLSFDNSGATTSSLSVSLTKSNETIVATSITVKYTDSSKSEESLSKIEGYVQLKNMKVQGLVDLTNDNAETLNDVVKLAVYIDNKKIGDVVFVTVDGTDEAYLQYADGTKEKLDVVFEPVISELETLEGDLG